MVFILIVLAIGAYFHFSPELDCTREGDVLLWYNVGGRKEKKRTYTFLFKWK